MKLMMIITIFFDKNSHWITSIKVQCMWVPIQQQDQLFYHQAQNCWQQKSSVNFIAKYIHYVVHQNCHGFEQNELHLLLGVKSTLPQE
jgi:hypothetical protein